MTDLEQKPRLRFKGFTEAWEQRKYEDIGSNFNGGTLSYASLDENGKLKCVLYGDLYTLYDSIILKIERKTNFKGNTIFKNDILFPQSTTVDAYSLISPACLNEETAETSGVFVIRPNKNIDGNFIAYYSKGNEKQRNKLAKNAQGLTIVHLYYQSIKNEILYIPNLKEQKMISAFFMRLDSLITLHQRKYEKLKSMKAALLEKMFPSENETTPKIRFKGFTEAWEQRKYEDIGSNFNGGTLSYASLDENGKLKCVLYGDLYTLYDSIILKIERKTNFKGNTIFKNDILFPQSTTVDAYSLISPACLNEETAETSGVFVIRPNKNIDGNFIAYYSKGNEKQRNKLAKNAQGLTIVHLYYQSIKNEILYIPNLKEQKMISAFFMRLDSLITLHQRKCEKLKNLKKSLLERMFI